jgi:hypothetical protein
MSSVALPSQEQRWRERAPQECVKRRGGLLEQWREEFWWFVRARCLLALRAVCRPVWGQGGGSSVGGGGWDGAVRGVRRVWGALSTAGGGTCSQKMQVGGGGCSCAAQGSAPRWMETRGGVVRHQRGVSRVSLLVGSGAAELRCSAGRFLPEGTRYRTQTEPCALSVGWGLGGLWMCGGAM